VDSPPTTTGYEAVEQRDRDGGSLYGAIKDTGGGDADERWRREHGRNDGTRLRDLMDPAMLSRMTRNTMTTAATGGVGGSQAMAGATFMAAVANGGTTAQRATDNEAASDISRASVGQTAAEEIAYGRQQEEVARRARAESAAAEMATSDRIRRNDQDRSAEAVPTAREEIPIERPAATQNRPSIGSSGTLITGDVAREVQSVLDSNSTNPDVQRAFDAMFESKRDGLKSQIREEASGVTDRAIGETFRTFLKGA
jgi:hypothetical protein